MSSKSENGAAIKATAAAKRAPYLPRGLRQRLADHFHLTVSAIDWRIKHCHPETIRVAKQMVREDYERQTRSRKAAEQKRRIRELKVREELSRLAKPGRRPNDQMTFLEELREADRA